MLQPVALGTAPDIDLIEYARGTLCSLSFVTPDTAREVHATRLHHHFERVGLAPDMRSALGSLQFLREAEPVDGGYWIPAPLRSVALDGLHSLLVGAHPTSELRRHFQTTRRIGAGRVASVADVASLPVQPLETWRGFDGLSARTWTNASILEAAKQLVPSVNDNALEVFGIRERPNAAGRGYEPTWTSINDKAVACAWRRVELFRARTGVSSYRHFLGQRTVGSTFLEGPATSDPIRMQFGLAAINGTPLTVHVNSTPAGFGISLPIRPPTSLRRLLFALCEEEATSFGRRWTCSWHEFLPTLQALFQELDCETKHT